MNEFYTYAYLREDGTPYYVGKGKGRRINSTSYRKFPPPPEDRRIFLKQNLTQEEAFKHEIYLISVLGRKDLGTGILRNLTDGGDGGGPMKGRQHSEETKNKMRLTKLGKKHTVEERENMSKAHLGKSNPKSGASRKGIKFSEEHKKNKSLAMKAYWANKKRGKSNGN